MEAGLQLIVAGWSVRKLLIFAKSMQDGLKINEVAAVPLDRFDQGLVLVEFVSVFAIAFNSYNLEYVNNFHQTDAPVDIWLCTKVVSLLLVSLVYLSSTIVAKETVGLVFRLVVAVLFTMKISMAQNEQVLRLYHTDVLKLAWFEGIIILLAVQAIYSGRGNSSNTFEAGESCHISNSKTRAIRIVFLSLGSRGDVQPFVALAVELRNRGHVPVICTMGKYKSLVERYGIKFARAGIEDIQNKDRVWRRAQHVSEVMKSAGESMGKHYKRIANHFLKACRDNDADLIIATTITISFALSIGEKMNIPSWNVKFAPDTPTRSFPPPGWKNSPIGFVNLLHWYIHWVKIGLAAIQSGMGGAENEFRTNILHLAPLGGGLRMRQLARTPTLGVFSSVITPKPKEWPTNFLTTGWWYAQEPKKAAQEYLWSDEFTAFLSGDGPCACITFGSMTEIAESYNVIERVLEGLSHYVAASKQGSRLRVLLLKPTASTGGVINASIRPHLNVFSCKEAPHEQIFSQCACVIHHGGAGTTARVLEFGLPSVIIPIMLWADQPFWADRIEALGAGAHLSRESSTLELEVSAVMESILGSKAKVAKALSEQLEREGSGVARAADAILG